jgi:hypothetical protein
MFGNHVQQPGFVGRGLPGLVFLAMMVSFRGLGFQAESEEYSALPRSVIADALLKNAFMSFEAWALH